MFVLVAALATLGGCAVFFGGGDLSRAEAVAAKGGLEYGLAKAPPFVLTTFSRMPTPGAPLHVFLEGDGHAWRNRAEVSPDPTPDTPVALEIAAIEAAAQPNANILYLARPCQYTPRALNPTCKSEYWTSQRYAEEVVEATQSAIDQAVQKGRTRGVRLLGYSGGAALAALVAVRRPDVLSLRSVAGNLDPDELNRYHGVSPLSGLDAAATAPALAGIPQVHWIGGRDTVVPTQIAQAWLKKSGDARQIQVRVVPQAAHGDGWATWWASGAASMPDVAPALSAGKVQDNKPAAGGRPSGGVL